MARKQSAVRRYRALVEGAVFEHEGSAVTHAVVAVADPGGWPGVVASRLGAPAFEVEAVREGAARDVDDYASHRMRVAGTGEGGWVAVNVKGHVAPGVPGVGEAVEVARALTRAAARGEGLPGPVLVGFKRGAKAARTLAETVGADAAWAGWDLRSVQVEEV